MFTNLNPRLEQNIGNGVTTEYAFNHKFYEATDLVVSIYNTTTNVTTTLTLNTDYTLSSAPYTSGATVTLNTAYSSDYIITIYSQVPVTQVLDLILNGDFSSEDIEEALDRATTQIRELYDKSTRTVNYALTVDQDVVNGLQVIETPVAGRALIYNSDLSGIINSTIAPNELLPACQTAQTNAEAAQIAAEAAQTAAEAAQTAAEAAQISIESSATQITTNAANIAQNATDISNLELNPNVYAGQSINAQNGSMETSDVFTLGSGLTTPAAFNSGVTLSTIYSGEKRTYTTAATVNMCAVQANADNYPILVVGADDSMSFQNVPLPQFWKTLEERINQISKNDMSANSDGGYIVSASSYYGAGHEPYKGFNGSVEYTTNSWLASNGETTGWLKIQLPIAKVVNKYILKSPDNYSTFSPKTWTFEGSNNGTDWTTIDTRSNETGWSTSEARTYTFSNSIAYLYYRINVTAIDGGTTLCIGELELYNTTPTNYIPQMLSLYDNSGTISDKFNNTVTNNNVTISSGKFVFNGTSSYLKIPTINTLGKGKWFREADIKFGATASSTERIFGTKAIFGVQLQRNSDNKLYFYASSNGSTWDIADGVAGTKSDYNTSTTYNIKIVFDGSYYKVYVDGVEDISVTSSSLVYSNIDALLYGVRENETAYFFNGEMSNIKVCVGNTWHSDNVYYFDGLNSYIGNPSNWGTAINALMVGKLETDATDVVTQTTFPFNNVEKLSLTTSSGSESEGNTFCSKEVYIESYKENGIQKHKDITINQDSIDWTSTYSGSSEMVVRRIV